MKRREFISLLGGAAAAFASPPAARAQQSKMPVIGFLSVRSPNDSSRNVAAFRQGLAEAGYVEGANVAIEYRWGEGRFDRLPALAAELIRHPVAALVVGSVNAARAVMAETTTIPIIFVSSGDPVELGLVASFNRPGANVTGATFLSNILGAKTLQLLSELVPKVTVFGLLVNPNNVQTENITRQVQAAADTLGRKLVVIKAAAERDFDPAFASFIQQGVGALLIPADPVFDGRAEQLVTQAARHALPTIYSLSEYAIAGGLMSYGTSITGTFRQVGVYTGRILKGDKPSDLPVVQPTRFEMVINLKTAKTLGLTVPLTLQVAADEVIE